MNQTDTLPPSPLRIGLTGGIGSGKSYVSRRLESLGIAVYDCDAAAKRLMHESETLRTQLTSLIGPDTYIDGRLNKPAVAAFIMQDEQHLRAVNAIVHPAVFRDFTDSPCRWVESAILFESGLRNYVDRVVCVTAPLETRVDRVMRRDGISREKTLEWMDRQMPQEEVCRMSDYEIINDGQHDLDEQINSVLAQLENSKTSDYSDHDRQISRVLAEVENSKSSDYSDQDQQISRVLAELRKDTL